MSKESALLSETAPDGETEGGTGAAVPSRLETPELSAEDLVNQLHSSRSSISQATRRLVQAGLIERRRRRGERRDFFPMRSIAWNAMVEQRVQALTTLRTVAERGLEVLNSDNPEARRGLEEMKDYFDFWEHELLPLVFEKLKVRQMEKGGR